MVPAHGVASTSPRKPQARPMAQMSPEQPRQMHHATPKSGGIASEGERSGSAADRSPSDGSLRFVPGCQGGATGCPVTGPYFATRARTHPAITLPIIRRRLPLHAALLVGTCMVLHGHARAQSIAATELILPPTELQNATFGNRV